jgi:hypothetical protein
MCYVILILIEVPWALAEGSGFSRFSNAKFTRLITHTSQKRFEDDFCRHLAKQSFNFVVEHPRQK